jgi:hypothetical protein
MMQQLDSTVRYDNNKSLFLPVSTTVDTQRNLAWLLQNHIYGRVEDDVWDGMVQHLFFVPSQSRRRRPPLPRQVHVEPAWFQVRMSELDAAAALCADLMDSDDDDDDDYDEEEEGDHEDFGAGFSTTAEEKYSPSYAHTHTKDNFSSWRTQNCNG